MLASRGKAEETMKTELELVAGRHLRLRLVTPADAGYIHGLRTDPLLCEHLSEVSGSIGAQRDWIERYKEREAAGREFYYVIERNDGAPCGLVRLYDIGEDRFTWGSWTLDRNKPAKAALESAVLSFKVGFESLGLDSAILDVRRMNCRAIAFYRRFGMKETGQDERNLYFQYSRDQFLKDLSGHMIAIESTSRG